MQTSTGKLQIVDLLGAVSPGLATPEFIQTSIERALAATELGTVATINPSGHPHVNSCFFSFDFARRKIIFLTSPAALHSKNISKIPRVGFNVFPSNHVFGAPLLGVQLSGVAALASAVDNEMLYSNYASRFPKILDWAASFELFSQKFESRLYTISLEAGKVIDETNLGNECYVSFRF